MGVTKLSAYALQGILRVVACGSGDARRASRDLPCVAVVGLLCEHLLRHGLGVGEVPLLPGHHRPVELLLTFEDAAQDAA